MSEPVFQSVRKLQYSYLVNGVVGNMMRQHYHDGYEVYLQLDGRRNIFFDGRKYVLERGSMFLIEPFVLHITTNSEEAVCSRNVMNFKRDTLAEFLSDKEINSLSSELRSCIIQLDEPQIGVIEDHFRQIEEKWLRFRHGGEKRCEKLAYIEVYRLLDKILYLKENVTGLIRLESSETVTDHDIYRVLEFIGEHYAEDIRLDDMVRYSHMSKSSFYRAFRRVTGDTFGNYLMLYRLAKAHKLIMETDLKLGSVALKTGFASTAQMSRAFRIEYGVSPSCFRKNENI